MNKMTLKARNFVKDTGGANLIEYVILVGVVAVLCLGIFRTFGTMISSKVNNQTDTLGTINE